MDHLTQASTKLVGIHQPNFMPWLGFFYKISRCDQFVILDNVDFQQGNASSLTNRTKIKCLNEIRFFTISVKKNTDSKLIMDILVDKKSTNIAKQIRTLQYNYAKAAYYKEIFPIMNDLLTKSMEYDSMRDVNEFLIKSICELLEIATPLCRASELPVTETDRNMRIIDICKALEAGSYFSGNGGKKYHDEALFVQNGISIKYTDFVPKEYEQGGTSFISGLSVIDVLFNCGAGATKNMLHERV